MSEAIELSKEERIWIKKQVEGMDSDTFRLNLARLQEEFESLYREASLVAQRTGIMLQNCRHEHRRLCEHGGFLCSDCGEYKGIKTDFSPEVEKWFAEQNRIVKDKNSEQKGNE